MLNADYCLQLGVWSNYKGNRMDLHAALGPDITADVLQLWTCVGLTSRGSWERGSESAR